MFYKKTEIINNILAKEKVNQEDINIILDLISDENLSRYFFRKDLQPEWMEILHTRGFFYNTPEPITDENSSAIYKKWSAGDYLKKQSKNFPDEICEIIKKIRTTNFFVVEDLIDSSIQIPFTKFDSIKNNILSLLENSGNNMFIPLSYEKIINYLMNNKEYDTTVGFCKSLYKPVLPQTKDAKFSALTRIHSRFENDHWVFETWEKTNPKLSKLIPQQYLAIHEELLWEFTSSFYNQLETEGKSKYGQSRWRSSIESSDQNIDKYDIRDIYIDSIVDCLKILCNSNPHEAEKYLEKFSNDSFGIFRRISFSILTEFGCHFLKLLNSVIGDKNNWDDTETYHEFFLLYTKQFKNLEEFTRIKFISYFFPENYEIEINKKNDFQIIRNISPISKFLDEERKKIYSSLEKIYHKPERPEFLSWHSTVEWVQPKAPISNDKFQSLAIKERLTYIKNFKPTTSDSFIDHARGLGELIEYSVIDNPTSYINEVNSIISTHLSNYFSRYIIHGLIEVARKKKLILNNNLLSLIQYYINRKSNQVLENDVDTKVILRNIADLLFALFSHDNKVDLESEQSKIITIFRKLLSKSEREETPEDDLDPITSSLNTICGISMKGLLEYLRFQNRRVKEQLGDSEFKPSIPEGILSILDENLQPKYKNPGLRSVYGQYLPMLYYYNKSWAKNNIKKIFIKIDNKNYSDGWIGYILSNKLYSDLFNSIKLFYKNELLKGKKTYDFKFFGTSAEERIIEHLLVAFLNEIIKLDDPLMTSMFSSMPDKELGHIGFCFYKALKEIKPKANDEKWKRIFVLWNKRINHYKKAAQITKNNNEISSYLRMLPMIPADEKPSKLEEIILVSINSLKDDEITFPRILIIDYCIKISKHNPDISIRIIEKIIDTDKPVRIMDNKDFEKIFINAKDSKNKQLINSSDRIINILGSQEDFRWEEYLSDQFK